MNHILPKALQGWDWPQGVEDAVIPMPRTLLAKRARRGRGDQAFIAETVAKAWVTSFSPTTARIPCGSSPACEDILVMQLKVPGHLSGAGARRLRELVHAAVPHPLVLIVAGGTAPMLSITPLLDGKLARLEPRALDIGVSAPYRAELLSEFNTDRAVSLTQLYGRMQCAFVAADLQQRLLKLKAKEPRLPSACRLQAIPEKAWELLSAFAPLEREFTSTWKKLNKGPRVAPRHRSKLLEQYRSLFTSLRRILTQHSIL